MRKFLIYSAIVVGLVVFGFVALIAYSVLTHVPRRPTGNVPIEFRIVADSKHDQTAIERGKALEGVDSAPQGYRWIAVDEQSSFSPSPENATREVNGPDSKRKTYVLVKLDRHNVAGRDFAELYRTSDELGKSALGFSMTSRGARKLGALTREHLPENDGQFKYHLAIIIDGRLISAPAVNTEIRNAGIIEWGPKGPSQREIDELISNLTR